MAFERPTLAEIVDRVQSDFVSRLELAGALLRRSADYVIARVLAGASHMMHGHIEDKYSQMLPDTADETNLLRWGGMFGVDRNEATFWEGTATITGTNGLAAVEGEFLVRADGTRYEIDADVTIAGGTGIVTITAEDAGTDPNADVGTEFEFESPVAGVDSTAEVATSVDGTDEEDIEDYRERVLDRMRNPPNGGSAEDYETWAKEVSGVTRAWAIAAQFGYGTVGLYFVRDDDVSLIPSAGEVTEVQDYVDSVRPVTAAVTVAAPTAAPLDFEIAVTPDTTTVRDAVEAELEDLIFRECDPTGHTLELWEIRQAIGSAAGLTSYDLTLVDGLTPDDVVRTVGNLTTLGTITWA
jgi:uncharacterized phage protein gp47/JayE